eukprot:gene9497-12794_t
MSWKCIIFQVIALHFATTFCLPYFQFKSRVMFTGRNFAVGITGFSYMNEPVTSWLSNRNLLLITNEEKKRERGGNIIHFELFPKTFLRTITQNLPLIKSILSSKPIAKVGIRSYSTQSSNKMDQLLETKFNISDPFQITTKTSFVSVRNQPIARPPMVANDGRYQIGIFVYMWVDPSYRGQDIGNFLLQLSISACLNKGDDFMLIVHDDNGSGKLIDYYIDRGFVELDEILEKGMILRL